MRAAKEIPSSEKMGRIGGNHQKPSATRMKREKKKVKS
jgi:hypothetical protein